MFLTIFLGGREDNIGMQSHGLGFLSLTSLDVCLREEFHPKETEPGVGGHWATPI